MNMYNEPKNIMQTFFQRKLAKSVPVFGFERGKDTFLNFTPELDKKERVTLGSCLLP